MGPLTVYTFVTDPAQQAAMRASMAAAGYDVPGVEFVTFDNTGGPAHDPYVEFGRLLSQSRDRVCCVCHQDVRFGPGTTFAHLARVLDELTARDPTWLVAGDAGRDHRSRRILHLSDPGGDMRQPVLPWRVQTLDENLLIVNAGPAVRFDGVGRGFHFYGSELCLYAGLARRTCYVVDLPVRHLSAGNTTSAAFADAHRAFVRRWRPRLLVGLIYPMCADVEVSRLGWVEIVVRWWPVRSVLRRLRLNLIRWPGGGGGGG